MMPPNAEVQIPDDEVEVDNQIFIVLTPVSEYSSSLEDTVEGILSDEYITGDDEIIQVGDSTLNLQEECFRDFLIKITNTEDLSTVTQLKLRVISREVTLQHLSIYTPALRELTLDGSAVYSLRDIGIGLKNLKILKVNRCGLNCIDGVFSIEQLEELYASDNEIDTLAPCAFLSCLRILDVRRNNITKESVTYLSFCDNIEELYLEGNLGIQLNVIAELVHGILPHLKSLDGFLMIDVLNNTNERNEEGVVSFQNNRNISNETQRSNFTVDFPPRVVLQRYFYNL
ncbi:unnamed protein product [Phyllotreta striolata]|uniref:Uncharacterized protein n=1 Tax=Phyllotreta striolata TaxID=444603 RepID=A0A9N9THC2_PHYSR|nr:unnamed protein product [Phyllotreta striolata]